MEARWEQKKLQQKSSWKGIDMKRDGNRDMKQVKIWWFFSPPKNFQKLSGTTLCGLKMQLPDSGLINGIMNGLMNWLMNGLIID